MDRALYRTMRAEGWWPLLISLETQRIANLVTPDGRVARRVKLRHPASAERVLHLVPMDLDECRLTQYGIATPTVGEEVLGIPWRPQKPIARPRSARAEVETTPARPAPRSGTSAIRVEDIRRRLPPPGHRTTLSVLRSALQIDDEGTEQELRRLLDQLQGEGSVRFDRPLGLFGPIDVLPPSY